MRARIVIIGGGAVGAGILWHLAAAGQTDTVLVEKHELTSGSTWHAAGNVPTFSNTWLGQRAGNYAWRLYSELAEDPDDPITYRHTSAIWPGHTESRMDHFHYLLSIGEGLGFDLELLSPKEIEDRHPFWQDDGTVLAGLLDPYEGDIDPSQLTQGLVRRARVMGASAVRHTRVVGLDQTNDGWNVDVVGPDGPDTIECEMVINAAGFYAAEIGRMAGVELPLAVLAHQYLVTDSVPALEGIAKPFPLIRDPEIMFYLRQEQDALLFGNYGHPGRAMWTDALPDVFDSSLYSPDTDGIAETAEQAAAHIPLLGEVGIARFVNGPITYAPDANPLVGPTPGVRNFYQAAGVQIGITHAAAIGKVLTEMITGGDTEWDVFPWDPRRFGPWATAQYANDRACELYEYQYAEPYPHRIWESARPVQTTALHDRLADKGANFGQIAGWERAFWFSEEHRYDHATASFRDEGWHEIVEADCVAVRDHVGVMDHGGFTRYVVEGPGAGELIEYAFVGTAPAPGRVKLSYMLTPRGRVWSEATIACLEPDRYLLLGPTVARERDIEHLREHASGGTTVRIGTERTSTLMVMGPKSRSLLAGLTDDDLSREAAPWMSARDITVAGVGATALRVSFVGELGWELHVEDHDLVRLYDALQEAGGGIRDFGSYALNAMRIEKGYHGWGSEFDVEYTPFDVGIERFIAWSKPDFIGRDAVLAMRDQKADWSYGIFTVDLSGIDGPAADPAPSAPIRHGGEMIGFVTSASAGFRTGTRVALGYVGGRFADTDDGFAVDVLGETCPAVRHRLGVYDPDHHRPRS